MRISAIIGSNFAPPRRNPLKRKRYPARHFNRSPAIMFVMRAVPLVSVTLLCGAIALHAQQAGIEDPVLFRTGATFVRLDVQVLEKNKPVEGLTRDDFVIYDESVPQKVETFGREAEPLQVMFVLDVSGSMGRILARMAAVAQQSLEALRPDDETGVLLFARHTRLAQELLADRGPSLLALREAPLEKDLGGGTSLNEALLETCNYFRTLPPYRGRRALIVLTDNGGLNVNSPDDAVLRAIAENNIVVNAIVPEKTKPPEPPPKGVTLNPDFTKANIFHIATESGGEVFRADKPERLRELLEHIRLRYGLGYRAPQSQPGVWRNVRVELTPEAKKRHPKSELIVRKGYFAANS